ncbi:MAG: N-acetylmuramoyl-L-alanine amidase [Candidatus Solibacter usitatus]|nr:N-acetylmuramoyl-L-alanine amidase [Candidatus Solibacter usitatus]
MRSTGKAPGRLAGVMAGWQASRIDDPVSRLRFLRRSVGDRRIWDPRTEPGRAFLRKARGPLALALGFLILIPAGTMTSAGRIWRRGPVVTAQASEKGPETIDQVWQVEQNREFETYSNGLRIERRFETGNEPRRYFVYPRGAEDSGARQERGAPAGIVFHTTESQLADFREDQTGRIRLLGEALLEFVRRERAYHYLIDRFGRVWRVVKESDAANHAGHSVWADARWTYVNLNRSFIGVSVETVTQAGSDRPEATAAQIHSLRVLTAMLRARHGIAARNCVTHAQVSVNPANMRAGYHYDWAANFPYPAVGLPDNYGLASPGLWLFGFNYDQALVNVTGQPFWKGLLLGEEQLRQDATAQGMSVTAYRQALAERYRRILSSLKQEEETSKEKASDQAKEKQG